MSQLPPSSSDHRSKRPATPKPFWQFTLPLIWMGLIYFFSDQAQLPSAPGKWDWIIKKGLHATAYAILTGLWFRMLNLRLGRPLQIAMLISFLWAISDEWHQTFVPGRSGQAGDVIIDALGILAFALFVWSMVHKVDRNPG